MYKENLKQYTFKIGIIFFSYLTLLQTFIHFSEKPTRLRIN